MTKITTDFAGSEDAATRMTRLEEIHDFWWGDGAFVDAATLGGVRTEMNTIYDDTANGEAFGSWLVKWNALNEPDKLLNDTLKDANPAAFILADDTARIFGPDGVTAVSAPGTAVSLAADDWQGLVLGAELRSAGAVTTVGSPGTIATYNGGTGAGSSFRLNGSNSSGIIFDVDELKVFLVDIEVLTGSAQIRGTNPTGTQLLVLPSGRSRIPVYVPSGANIIITSGTDAAATTYTVHSVREITNWAAYQSTAAARPTWGRAPAQVRNLWSGRSDTPSSGSRTVTAVQHVLSFTGTGSVARSGVSTGTLVGTGANDRVQVAFTPTAGSLTLTITGDVRNLQLETGATRTTYQRRGVTQTDITESGVSSFGLLSFDGSDDALLHQLANGGTVAVALFGRGGSYLIPSITLTAPSVLQLGPLSVLDDGVLVSGCPTGILRAVGTVPWSSRFELVGYAVMKANPSAEEKARAMRYFAASGARGYFTAGANTAVNGGFGADTGWTKGTGWSIGAGVATKTAGSAAALEQAQTIAAAGVYLWTANITRSAGTLTPRLTGGTTFNGTAYAAGGALSGILIGQSGNTTLGFQGDASFAGTVDNVTLQLLTPEF